MDYLDTDRNGRLTVGSEIPLDCGVGFQCTFDPDTMSLETGVVTMIGTLSRTPRASITLSGILRLSDGQPAVGDLEWRSNDGLLRSSTTIDPDGRFLLAARTGSGTVSYLNWLTVGGDLAGCPVVGTPGAWSSGCTTGYQAVVFTKAFTGSLSGMDLTLPTFPGVQRTLRLQFADGTTGIRDAVLSIVGETPATCEVSTTPLGDLRACFAFQFSTAAQGWGGAATNSAGATSIYLPTGSDIQFEISSTASGVQWSDQRVSFRDDGSAPDAWLFPGLIFATTPGSFSVARGSSIEVASAVKVDGVDPAFGLSARLMPLGGQLKACASESVSSDSDQEGRLTFRVCPGVTGAWRIVSADGGFFPSAPFTISVISGASGTPQTPTVPPKTPPVVSSTLMVSKVTLKGAKIASRFNPRTSKRYSGEFTASTATFQVALTAAAKGAAVSATKCIRPSSGSRTCKVTVRLKGKVETYTFVLKRKVLPPDQGAGGK
jgi:hypothetical protein